MVSKIACQLISDDSSACYFPPYHEHKYAEQITEISLKSQPMPPSSGTARFGTIPESRPDILHLLSASSSTAAVDAARSLLARGFNPRAAESDGLTPLHVACSWDNLAICQLLLHFGANPLVKDAQGRTPLDMAEGNTRKFLQRYLARNAIERQSLLRRLFACHVGSPRRGRDEFSPYRPPFDVVPEHFSRPNPLLRSMRAAKERIRKTFNGHASQRRASTDDLRQEAEDAVPTSEGVVLLEPPPTTNAARDAAVQKSQSILLQTRVLRIAAMANRPGFVPDTGAGEGPVSDEGRKVTRILPYSKDAVPTSEGVVLLEPPPTTNAAPVAAVQKGQSILFHPRELRKASVVNKLPKVDTVPSPKGGGQRSRPRSKTPDAKSLGGNAKPQAPKKRSKTPDFALEGSKGRPRLTQRAAELQPVCAPIKPDPMVYYNFPQAGLFRRPTAPPIEVDAPSSTNGVNGVPKREAQAADEKATHSDYETADDKSLDVDELAERVNKVKIVNHDFVDDGDLRKIKRMRDPELRLELKNAGIVAGPICIRTRHMYEKKLLDARRRFQAHGIHDVDTLGMKFSPQLEMFMRCGAVPSDSWSRVQLLDKQLISEYARQGSSAFCYLLMDPRKLGRTADNLTFDKFVTSIFYVGKGTKNRPLQHFVDVAKKREIGSDELKKNTKYKTIDEIWTSGDGVGRHEISHGVCDDEAFVREAAMIEAIRLQNLANVRGGDWRGESKKWASEIRAEYGVFLLQNALKTLKVEGIRFIHEDDPSVERQQQYTDKMKNGASNGRPK